MKDLQFPVGISNFEKIREGGYYYIDKTNLISELLSGGIAEVTLITRPRRFGKSLGMEHRNFCTISRAIAYGSATARPRNSAPCPIA